VISCGSINGSKFQNKKNIYCQGIISLTPDKSKVSKAAPEQGELEMSSFSGMNSKLVSSNNNNNITKNSLDDFDFCEVTSAANQSKFFKKPSLADSDDASDNYESEIEDWTLSKKRKNNLTPTENNKKQNRKTTHKTRKKK